MTAFIFFRDLLSFIYLSMSPCNGLVTACCIINRRQPRHRQTKSTNQISRQQSNIFGNFISSSCSYSSRTSPQVLCRIWRILMVWTDLSEILNAESLKIDLHPRLTSTKKKKKEQRREKYEGLHVWTGRNGDVVRELSWYFRKMFFSRTIRKPHSGWHEHALYFKEL